MPRSNSSRRVVVPGGGNAHPQMTPSLVFNKQNAAERPNGNIMFVSSLQPHTEKRAVNNPSLVVLGQTPS